jgi:hypothetical protein
LFLYSKIAEHESSFIMGIKVAKFPKKSATSYLCCCSAGSKKSSMGKPSLSSSKKAKGNKIVFIVPNDKKKVQEMGLSFEETQAMLIS